MRAIKDVKNPNHKIRGLDGELRTWSEIQDKYWELLNPKKEYGNYKFQDILNELSSIALKIHKDGITTYFKGTKQTKREIFILLFDELIISNICKTNVIDAGIELRKDYYNGKITNEKDIYDSLFNNLDILEYAENSLIYKINQEYRNTKNPILKKLIANSYADLKKLVLGENVPLYAEDINNKNYKNLKKFFEETLYENWLRANYGHWFSEVFGIKACPYCNSQYTIAVEKGNYNHDFNSPISDSKPLMDKIKTVFKKIYRRLIGKYNNTKPVLNYNKALYQIDHIKDKGTYPLLAITLNNLIPSCGTCNNLKSQKSNFFNPIIESIYDKINFFFVYSSDMKIMKLHDKEILQNGVLKIKSNPIIKGKTDIENKVKQHIETFCLEGLNNVHKDIIEEIYWSKGKYDNLIYRSYAKSKLKSLYDKNEIDKSLDRYIYGNYTHDEDFHLRPHTKLMRDIINQLSNKT